MRPNVLALSFLFPNRAQRGYGVFVLNRLKAVQQFCNLRVIAPVQWYPLIGHLQGARGTSGIPAREQIEGVDVFHPHFAVVPRYMKWFDGLSYWWAARGVMTRLRRRDAFDVDLIDVHWTYPDIVAGYLLARRSGKKFIVTVRGHEALYDEEVSVRRWLVALLLRRADFVVTLSAELRDKVLRLGVSPQKSRVVLNGVDPARFRYMDRDSCRRRLGLSPTARIIISVGRLTRRKGHHELIRVMPYLLREAATDLYLIGGVNREQDYGSILRKTISELGLASVHIMENVAHDELPWWYGAADLFCLATMSEGCPNSVLEALACGTPVVATNAGAIGELITEGENGALVNSQEMPSLGEIVKVSLERPWDRRRIAARMEAWSWNACAEQVVSVYRTVLQ
jgi:teichuronic acid biosynthesis glycosyltransferase TuaC